MPDARGQRKRAAATRRTPGGVALFCGAMALNGAVTLDSNAITNAVVPVPEPMAMGALMVPAALLRRHRGRWPA